MSKRISKNRHI